VTDSLFRFFFFILSIATQLKAMAKTRSIQRQGHPA
jgi:hypothetical protein